MVQLFENGQKHLDRRQAQLSSPNCACLRKNGLGVTVDSARYGRSMTLMNDSILNQLRLPQICS